MKDLGDQTCAYCGRVIGDTPTRDHVVPSLLWLKGERPQQPVIVWACRPCHEGYDREAEYFRNMLVANSDVDAHQMIKKLTEGPVKRSVLRRPSVMCDLTRNLRLKWESSDSRLLVQPAWEISLNVDRFNRMIEKIVRGLYFFKSRDVLPSTHEVQVWPGNGFWENQSFQDLLQVMESPKHTGDDVFACRCHLDVNDPAVTAWLLLFYGHVGIFAWTLPATQEGTVDAKRAS